MEDIGKSIPEENGPQQQLPKGRLIHEIENELAGLAFEGLYYGLAGASLVMDAVNRTKSSDE
jgi:hypothetical protein